MSLLINNLNVLVSYLLSLYLMIILSSAIDFDYRLKKITETFSLLR